MDAESGLETPWSPRYDPSKLETHVGIIVEPHVGIILEAHVGIIIRRLKIYTDTRKSQFL